MKSGKPACASFPRLGWGRRVEISEPDLPTIDMVAQGSVIHKI